MSIVLIPPPRLFRVKEHFKDILNKAKNGLNRLMMTKYQLNTIAKLCIYHSLIHSHISYCALAWLNNINKEQLNMLKTLQKKAVRIVHGKKYNSHTNELFQKSDITKVKNIFEQDSRHSSPQAPKRLQRNT